LSPVLLIEAIPDAIEIIVLTIIWCAGGIAGGFFLYRIRNKKELGLFEARETALGNREKELVRIRTAMKAEQRTDNSGKLEATVTLLREELEQQSLEISIAKEEHGLELRILQDEIESLTRRPGETAGFAEERSGRGRAKRQVLLVTGKNFSKASRIRIFSGVCR